MELFEREFTALPVPIKPLFDGLQYEQGVCRIQRIARDVSAHD